eukprot:scaffold9877_cov101-Skeletonema_marinoi.AAC.1
MGALMGRIGVDRRSAAQGIILIEIWMMDGDDFAVTSSRPTVVRQEGEGRETREEWGRARGSLLNPLSLSWHRYLLVDPINQLCDTSAMDAS